MTYTQQSFTSLNDIKIGEVCNIFGLVKYCSNPVKTKGKDFKLTVSITDKSLGFDSKLICNLFNEKPENLPRIGGRGDVIIIHKLKITKYLDKPQGLGIQKQGYSVAVFSKLDLFDTRTDSFNDIMKKMTSNQVNFNITFNDLERVQELLEFGYDMPSSEIGEAEINLDSLYFQNLSEISPKLVCSMAVQIVSIISVEYLEYRTLLLVWDGTVPTCEINRGYIESLTRATKMKHSPELMAKLGGKLSNPVLASVLIRDEPSGFQQSFMGPGDLIYLTRVSVDLPRNGPGVLLVADRSNFGIIATGNAIYDELTTRLNNYSNILPCVADCISSDMDGNTDLWALQDFAKILKQLDSDPNQPGDSVFQFKIVSRVSQVHPSTEKEFYESILLYCTECQQLQTEDSENELSPSTCRPETCRKSLIPVPMVTVIFEDFTGWFTGVVVGKAVLDMMSLVMIDTQQPEWWVRLFMTRDKASILRWVHNIGRLKAGYIEAKLVFKVGAKGKVLPFIEDFVILDY